MRQSPFYITRRTVLLSSLLLLGCQLPPANAPKPLAPLDQLRLEWADIYAEREKGLMNRSHLGENAGMMFVFETPKTYCFWMKNTLLPLTAAFVADDGTIVNLADMKPQVLDSHCSKKPVRYVLEMNQGWFAKRGIKPGFKLTGIPFQSQQKP